ncbi:NUDIX hydrolase [Cytobacillus horneckiae]|uniref:NUDIX domain-containing protein n=1 Tax=Cytobacillus horneckiae TaxID=549687 RepID=UPI0039A3C69B
MNRPKIQVCCIPFRNEKMALVRRVKKKANTFMQLIPAGGHVENCEKLEESAVRELEEETGIKANNLELKGVISFITRPINDHAICFVYFSNTNSGELEAKEIDKVIPEWVATFNFEENNDIPFYYREFLKKAVKSNHFLNCVVEWNELYEVNVSFN